MGTTHANIIAIQKLHNYPVYFEARMVPVGTDPKRHLKNMAISFNFIVKNNRFSLLFELVSEETDA